RAERMQDGLDDHHPSVAFIPLPRARRRVRVGVFSVSKSRRPAFLDVQAPIDQEGADPGGDERTDDDKAHDTEVHPADRIPRTTAKVQLLHEELAQLE